MESDSIVVTVGKSKKKDRSKRINLSALSRRTEAFEKDYERNKIEVRTSIDDLRMSWRKTDSIHKAFIYRFVTAPV